MEILIPIKSTKKVLREIKLDHRRAAVRQNNKLGNQLKPKLQSKFDDIC